MKHLQNYNKKLNNIVSIIIIWFKFLDWIFSHLGPQGKGASRTTFGSFYGLQYLKCAYMQLGPQLYHFR